METFPNVTPILPELVIRESTCPPKLRTHSLEAELTVERRNHRCSGYLRLCAIVLPIRQKHPQSGDELSDGYLPLMPGRFVSPWNDGLILLIESGIGGLGNVPCLVQFSLRLFLVSHGPVKPPQPPVNINIVGCEPFRSLQFPQGIVIAACIRIEDAQIQMSQFETPDRSRMAFSNSGIAASGWFNFICASPR